MLQVNYFQASDNADEWEKNTGKFLELWSLTHCFGTIDGKHVAIKLLLNDRSRYLNYKGYFSIVLMAICDAHYVFMVADIDIYGFNNDSRRLRYSLKGQSFFENKTNKKMYHIFSYSRRE